MNQRIIFVGLHNKPGKVPLCSSTKSGKLIDRIIKEGGFTNVQKTNLFDVDYLPATQSELNALASDWYQRIEPQNEEIAVLLGSMVKMYMPRYGWIEFIEIPHPAHEWSHAAMDEYVLKAIAKINAAITKLAI